MALVKCRECGEQVSTKAKACLKCGAAPQKTSILRILFAVMVVIFLYAAVFPSDKSPPVPVDPAVAAKKAEDSDFYTRADMAMELVQKAAREPESVTFEGVYVSQDKGTVCVFYRGRNGFGGISRDAAAVSMLTGQVDTSATVRKKCAKTDTMRDMSYMARRR